jgi:hypothetical protein
MLSWRHDRTLPSRASRDVIPVRTGIAISLTEVPPPESGVKGPLARAAGRLVRRQRAGTESEFGDQGVQAKAYPERQANGPG